MPVVLDEALAVLRQTPSVLQALLAPLPERYLSATEGPEEWSPRAVLAHLIYGEQVNWLVRARHILAQDPRPFAPFDRTNPHADPTIPVPHLLHMFTRERYTSLKELARLELTPADLELQGLHPELGPVTLGQLLATWATHDLNHLVQITRTLAKANTEAVGPWRAFLGVLSAS